MHDKIGAGLRLSCSYDEDVEAEKGAWVKSERWNGAKLKVWEGRRRAVKGQAMAGDALPRFPATRSAQASYRPKLNF